MARASTFTVDDDKADCPNAAFSSLQAAVDQAAPHDTLIVCPGTYLEGTTPTTNAASPSQAGSHNGLTISKPLTIVGAGASKVVIAPRPSITTTGTLAGSAPYLRDGGGNVVTISRQSLGSTDADENRVDISGVTIASPTIAADAAVAFFNTSGSISNSVIGPVATGSYGYGVIETNSLLGGGLGTVRREVTISSSKVSGGVLFDDATGTDGAAANNVRSGIIQYGYVEGSHIDGAVTYRAGQRGHVTGSEIAGAVTLSDAEIGADPSNIAVRAFSATGNSLGAGLFNQDIAGAARTDVAAAATGNFWVGGVTTSGSVDASSPLTSAPAALPAPSTADVAPTASIVDPLDGDTGKVGTELDPVVVANDDFGVKSVALLINGKQVALDSTRPYEFAYTPTFADLGPLTLTALATDSSGKTTSTSIHLTVPNPAGYVAATLSPTSWDAGTVLVGLNATQAFTVTDSGQNPITLGAISATGSGFSVVPGGCATGATIPVGGSCIVTLKFAPSAEGASTGSLSVAYTAPGATGPLTATLAGNGHIFQTSQPSTPSGSVPATLALSFTAAPATFAPFVPGVAKDYTASLALNVISTAGDAALSISDPSVQAPGHLVNGAFSLPQPLQAAANAAAFATVSAAPLTLETYAAPVSNSPVTLNFKQSIGAADALRTGTYSKTVLFTLSTTTP